MSLTLSRTRLSSSAAACAQQLRGNSLPSITSCGASLVALAALSIGANAHAQNSASATLAPVVITASRSEQALPNALPSTKVISREQIEQSQAADLPALIRQFTAIDVGQTGPAGSQTSFFLRGADSHQVLLIVDGVPMNRANDGGASWEHLAIDQIERVEIVRGNVSAVWGAQAIGGVVQVFTRKASTPEFTVGKGTQRSAQASLAAGHKFGEGERATRVSMALSRRVSAGFDATLPAPGNNPDRDAMSQSAASARIEQGWAAGHQTSLNVSSTHTGSKYDGFAPDADEQVRTQVDAFGLSSRHALTPALEFDVDAGQTQEAFQDPTGFFTSGTSRTQQGQLQLQWQASAAHRLAAALEAKQEHSRNGNDAPAARHTRSLRLGWLGNYQLAGTPLEMQASLRNDDSNTYGSATTHLLALGWSPATAWKLSSQWSTAFSAPAFRDQQSAAPGVSLKPERARNIELASQYQQGQNSVRLAWFKQRQHDRIGFDGNNSVNVANAANRGFELMGQSVLGRTVLSGEAIWQNPRNLDNGRELARRARQTQVLSIQHPIGQTDVGASLRHTGTRRDSDFNNAFAPARTTLALSGGWKISPAWRLAAKLDNATSDRHSEVVGYTPAPRSLGVSLSGKL